MKRFVPALVFLLFGSVARPHDIITTNLTYTRDISRIFAQRCLACHSASSTIPLTNYEEARPWAVAIKEQVLSRAMPPWGAVKGFGNLQPDHALSQEEIMIIAAWVIGGAPKGDVNFLAKPLVAAASTPLAPLHDALTVTSKAVLTYPLLLAAVRPLAPGPVDSARITARLPNGRIEPLVWLYRFQAGNRNAYRLRDPLSLPAGTIVESSAPLRFSLESK